MLNLKNELKKVINRYGLGKEFEAFWICQCAEEIIKKDHNFLPNLNKNKIKVKKYLSLTKTLEIETADFLLGQKLRNKSNKLIGLINKKTNGEFISKIRFKLV